MSVSPWIVSSGDVVRVGSAVVIREGNELYIKDMYVERRFKIDREANVELIPVPPINTPSKITNALYIKFTTPIVSTGGREYWVRVPYEIVVMIDETPIVIINPFKVKYTLYGSIIDGLICRYYESAVFNSLSEAIKDTDEGVIKIVVPGSDAAIMYEFTILDADAIDIYRDSNDLKVYYEAIILSPNLYKPFARALNEPSKSRGVEKVSIPWNLSFITSRPGGVEHGYYGPS